MVFFFWADRQRLPAISPPRVLQWSRSGIVVSGAIGLLQRPRRRGEAQPGPILLVFAINITSVTLPRPSAYSFFQHTFFIQFSVYRKCGIRAGKTDAIAARNDDGNPVIAGTFHAVFGKFPQVIRRHFFQCAYIRASAKELEEMTADHLREFAENRVEGSGYNWVSIIVTGGNGICFPGSDISFAEYGKLDEDGSLLEGVGTWTRQSDGSYVYSEKGSSVGEN